MWLVSPPGGSCKRQLAPPAELSANVFREECGTQPSELVRRVDEHAEDGEDGFAISGGEPDNRLVADDATFEELGGIDVPGLSELDGESKRAGVSHVDSGYLHAAVDLPARLGLQTLAGDRSVQDRRAVIGS